jgi:hypothetical protein
LRIKKKVKKYYTLHHPEFISKSINHLIDQCSFFVGVYIHLYNGKSSAFQAEIAGMSSSAGRIPAVMKVIAFQAKVSQ